MAMPIEKTDVERVLRPWLGSLFLNAHPLAALITEKLSSYAPYRQDLKSLHDELEVLLITRLNSLTNGTLTVILDNYRSRRLGQAAIAEMTDDLMGVVFDRLTPFSANFIKLNDYSLRNESLSALPVNAVVGIAAHGLAVALMRVFVLAKRHQNVSLQAVPAGVPAVGAAQLAQGGFRVPLLHQPAGKVLGFLLGNQVKAHRGAGGQLERRLVGQVEPDQLFLRCLLLLRILKLIGVTALDQTAVGGAHSLLVCAGLNIQHFKWVGFHPIAASSRLSGFCGVTPARGGYPRPAGAAFPQCVHSRGRYRRFRKSRLRP